MIVEVTGKLKPGDDMGRFFADKYFIKTRNMSLSESVASGSGIRRVYNYTSDINFMDSDDVSRWVSGLVAPGSGEAVIVEKAIKTVSGVPLFVSSCIVFNSIESCNVFYMKNIASYRKTVGFEHLYN